MWVDERGVGLRATWHPDSETCTLSIWHGERCAASFRLPVRDVPDMAGFLTSVMSDWALDVHAERAVREPVPEPTPQAGPSRPRHERLLRQVRRYVVQRSLR